MDVGMLALIITYAVLPNLYYRSLSNQVIRKVPAKDKTIALTFDDGPDPRYTPELLEVLKKNGIKCTFFILAEKASKYPDIIRRIIDDGHQIGLHSLNHINPIFRLPNQTKKDFENSVGIMNELGVKVRFFRPPWGIFNPVTYHYAREHNFRVMLWSKHAGDWSRWTTVDSIIKRLTKNVQPGDIILLHDGRGAPNAPRRTIQALETVLPRLKAEGYRFLQANEL